MLEHGFCNIITARKLWSSFEQNQSPCLSTARISETASGRMKGVMAGTRPRASTLKENVFTVSRFLLQSNMDTCRLRVPSAATEDKSALERLDRKESRNKSTTVEMSPRRPEVGRIGVMHSHLDDGLNFSSPDP
jgi:hypothetical protein